MNGVCGSPRKVVLSGQGSAWCVSKHGVTGMSLGCHWDVTQRDVASAAATAEVPVSSGLFTPKSHLLQNLLCLIKELSLQHLCTKGREG